MIATYYHDVPPELASEALKRERAHPSATSLRESWPLEAWPDVPTRFVLCRDDRVFPANFLRRVAEERLGITPDEIDGGHCVALSRPKELADRLEAYLAPQTPHQLADSEAEGQRPKCQRDARSLPRLIPVMERETSRNDGM